MLYCIVYKIYYYFNGGIFEYRTVFHVCLSLYRKIPYLCPVLCYVVLFYEVLRTWYCIFLHLLLYSFASVIV